MGFADKVDAIKRGERVLVDGPHLGQHRTLKRLHREVSGLVEFHVDAVTDEPVTTYDATMSTAGTVTYVYLPPAPPASSGGAVVPGV